MRNDSSLLIELRDHNHCCYQRKDPNIHLGVVVWNAITTHYRGNCHEIVNGDVYKGGDYSFLLVYSYPVKKRPPLPQECDQYLMQKDC